MCHDSTTMTDSCHPKSTGCPVTCLAGEHVCHSPPLCAGCDGYNWCSSHTCPLTCGMHEVLCHDATTMTDSCHPATSGCPVTCPAGDHVCHSVATCQGCHAYNWVLFDALYSLVLVLFLSMHRDKYSSNPNQEGFCTCSVPCIYLAVCPLLYTYAGRQTGSEC